MTRQRLRENCAAAFRRLRFTGAIALVVGIQLIFGAVSLWAQDSTNTTPELNIYGFAMLDTGYETGQSDPNWFDTMRPSKLQSFPDQYGKDGRWFAGVRQSRFGVKADIPTSTNGLHLKTIFEFELFGTGVDAGQTTFRLRHAYGELGKFGAGQTWSLFMDPDVFPNSIEYWGPNGMVFFRNVQARFIPWSKGGSSLMVAIERPGASADQGIYADRIELGGVTGRFPAPDVTGQFRMAGKKGHIQVAGIYRRMNYDDLNATPTFDLTGHANGWGINVSSNIKLAKHVVRLQYVHGEGIENYMNDAPADIGVQSNPGNTKTPIVGKALPITGIVSFVDLNFSDKWSSTVGYSFAGITNSDGQGGTAMKNGHYGLGNVMYYPVKGAMMGPEIQWGQREGKNGFTETDYKFQFSAKYNFNFKVGG